MKLPTIAPMPNTLPTATDDNNQRQLNWFGGIVSLLIIGLLWFITFALIYKEIPASNQTNLAQIIGMIGIQVGIIIGWFFRGSQNEVAQSKTIALQADTAAKAQAALSPALAKPVVATVETPSTTIPLKEGDTATVVATPTNGDKQ